MTDQEEFALAQQSMKSKKWDKARLHFQRLSDRFPGSALASEAMLGKADSFFEAGDLGGALTEYQLFLEFYPSHDKADLALFRVGVCQSGDIQKQDRDQAPTLEAVKTFEKFLTTYPKSSMLAEARQRLGFAQERLKNHELYVARFYERRQVYVGAMMRYRKVLSDYPLTDEEKGQYQAAVEKNWKSFMERRLRYVQLDAAAEQWFSVLESVQMIRYYRPEQALDEDTSYAYAEALYQLKQTGAAKVELQNFIQAFPGSPKLAKAREYLGELAKREVPSGIEGDLRQP